MGSVHSTFYLCEELGFKRTGLSIKIEKYNSIEKCFSESCEIALGQITGFDLALCANDIFVLGGFERSVVNSVSTYDVRTKKEKRLPGMADARECPTSVSVGKYIYVFGGIGGHHGLLNSVERLDTEVDSWSTLQPMNTRRCEASAAIMDGIIYVGGSSGETVEAGKSFESFDPRANKWTQLASMQHDRSDFALVGSNGYLYAMGKNKIIERFDRRANRWTEMRSFEGSDLISDSICMNDKVFATMASGEFGRVHMCENGICSFELLRQSYHLPRGRIRLLHHW